MTQPILAIFADSQEAVATARALRRAGLTRLELLSEEPLHAAIADEEPKSRIGIFAVLGGVLGAGAALWLTIGTAKGLAINTGGMPVVSGWAYGIIVFEVTMLSAIIAALARMIWEAGLARPGAMQHYDAAVTDNKIVLVVNCEDEQTRQTAEQLLADTNAEMIGK
ncbi:MAG: DUF3341 domain-containing protein [Acidobacteria bacterium]|nr:DUF3341 domain-containing protein [Acidobacteriota bacterium]